jgi:chromosomal replication initiation ATPase DnaA
MKPASRVLHAVCSFFGLTPIQLIRDGRQQHIDVRVARHVAMWLLHMRGMSYPEVARALGLADHTSCMYGVRQVRASEWLHACALAIDEWLVRDRATLDRRAA